METAPPQQADKIFSEAALARELNPRQLEAVNTLRGPVLILAGAGSGKTRVITFRIARLIDEGADPRSIMALTFTNKAAAEMKERTVALLGRGRIDLWISTFHSACLRILRRNAERINYPKDFTVYDANDQKRLIKSCLEELHIPEKLYPARLIGSIISKYKNKLMGPEEAAGEMNAIRDKEILECFHLYEKKLNQSKCMDFDDLLGKAVTLFRRDEEMRAAFQDRFDHILVDEFQDTNAAQYELVRLLVGAKRNICVVGDDDQSIYQWRGADIRNILDFEKDYPEAAVILLEQNYRSTANIIESASTVVSLNPGRKEKRLWTENDAGEHITLYKAEDETGEAMFLTSKLRDLVKRNGKSLNDVAVFYRTNSQSRALEDALRREGFAYQIYGGLKFYERKEVKDILAYFHAAMNPHDDLSFKRVVNTPPRGIGNVTVEKMAMAAAENGTPLSAVLDDIDSIEGLKTGAKVKLENFREILSHVRTYASTEEAQTALEMTLNVSGYREWLEQDKNSESLSRLDNLDELVNAAAEFRERTGDGSVAAFLDQSALVSDADKVEDGEGQGAVKLMTVHISKGLEFPVVFVTGLEDNLFPHARSKEDITQMHEERRLLYVAMTRAMEKLYITYARSRMILGVRQNNLPSLFLNDLPEERLDREFASGFGELPGMTSFEPAPAASPSRKVFSPKPEKSGEPKSLDGIAEGAKVSHAKFGVGIVRTVDGKGDKAKIEVYFPKYGAKKLVKKFANLEVVK